SAIIEYVLAVDSLFCVVGITVALLAVFFICQRHHITYHFQLRRPPADAKSCAFIKTVPNPSEKTGQLYCGRQCRKQKGATPAQPRTDKTASRMVSCAAQGE